MSELNESAVLAGFAADLSTSARFMHTRMKEKGFWDKVAVLSRVCRVYVYDEEDQADIDQLYKMLISEKLMLAVGELSEAQEALRKSAKDDKLPQHDGLPVEIIDCIIRLQDLLGFLQVKYGYDVEQIYLDKVAFNSGRPHKHGKEF